MKKNTEIILGNVNFDNGEVYVTDPCYNTNVWCMTSQKIKAGEYIAKAIIEDCGDWGKRVSNIIINFVKNAKTKATHPIFHNVGVDSGQCGFFDKEYYEEYHNFPTYINDVVGSKEERWYDRVCTITCNDANHCCGIIDGLGVVGESGFGDGCYTLYAGYNSKEEIVALRIRFI